MTTHGEQDDTETWRPVVGFEPYYDVSDLGRIRRSLTARGPGSTPGRIRRLWVSTTTGYPETVLYLPPRIPHRLCVHVLVCTAFHGPCPGPDYEVGHRDADRGNPRADNLTWMTRGENRAQSYRDGRPVRGAAAAGPGTARPNALLDDAAVLAIRAQYRAGSPRYPGNARELAERYGVSVAAVRSVAARRSWTHVQDADGE